MIVDIIDYIRSKLTEKLKLLIYGIITVSLIGNGIFIVALKKSEANNESLATSVQVAIADFNTITRENTYLSNTVQELTGELNTTITHIVELRKEKEESDLAVKQLQSFSKAEIELLYEDLERKEEALQQKEQELLNIPVSQLIIDLERALETYKY